MTDNTGNEAVAIGGRPGAGQAYENLTSFSRPLADSSARRSTPTARNVQEPVISDFTQLPLLVVARQVVGAEILRLRATEAAIERELSRGTIGANGQPNPYLIQRAAENRAELEHIREQIARLSNLDDNRLRVKAFELGAR